MARWHRSASQTPRGAWLAFVAVAMQVLVPFFLMVEIARASEPGGATVICSSLGHDTHQDDAAVEAQDATLMHVSLKPLRPGSYKVHWHAVSVDTHATDGTFTFTVK